MKLTAAILMISFTFSLNSFAANKTVFVLKFNFSRLGTSVCDDLKVVKDGDLNLICEGMSGDNRIFVKVLTKLNADQSILVTAFIEEVSSTGVVTLLSNPSIQTLVGERAEMTQSDDSGEFLTFRITPDFTE